MTTIGFVGGGQMARALASGFSRAGILTATDLIVTEPYDSAWKSFAEAVPSAKRAESNAELAAQADQAWLCVKPQAFGAVASELNGKLKRDALVVSILAGVSLDRLSSALGHRRVVRVMPNTPALVLAGASAFCATSEVSVDERQRVQEALSAVGTAHEVSESQMDAVTGLSGSGPAFVFVAIEALADGGVLAGLPRPLALSLATQTVLGAARLAAESGKHPGELKDQVASPGGTTIAGLATLEDRGFRGALVAAVAAAAKRSAELGSK
ncbi:MAG TPA: pyrroline-5-carboxylate reductase [Pirellulaceae bacterium]|jgi:pyrroline-5-carboxylate reductase|nr:pyrroline-5-carboxylate reductase [Pirellulaceae bacterium]